MSLRVILTEPAEHEFLAASQWWARHRSLDQATRWYEGFQDALETLRNNPERCALARENPKFPFELRELHYGLGSRPTHRALFTIRPDMVLVLTVRHAAQQDFTPEDL